MSRGRGYVGALLGQAVGAGDDAAVGESVGHKPDSLEDVAGIDAVHAVEQVLAGHGETGPLEAELPHGLVEAVRADEAVEHVGRGVVADDDHEGCEVADGRAEAARKLLQDSAARRTVGVRQLQPRRGVDDAHVHLPVELDQYRDLESAGCEVEVAGLVGELLSGLEVLRGHAGDGGDCGDG